MSLSSSSTILASTMGFNFFTTIRLPLVWLYKKKKLI